MPSINFLLKCATGLLATVCHMVSPLGGPDQHYLKEIACADIYQTPNSDHATQRGPSMDMRPAEEEY